MTISFKDKVAIVTGAGGGLGRCHALQFAERGAKVIVNDLGGSVDGSGGSSEAADKVVDEIKAMGGDAISNGSSVTDKAGVKKLVDDAMAAYGRIDILVNNAGVLRDKSFAKVTLDDFEFVVDVHMMGSVYCTKAVWPIMVEQKYGRIVMTSSSSGIFGNFGQSNYGSAKMGVVGLMNTLRIEGQKNNIKVNSLVPVAATRMTENLGMPDAVFDSLKPESVSPAVIFMSSEDAPDGVMISAGAGVFAMAEIVHSEGIALKGDDLNADMLAEKWSEASDMTNSKALRSGAEHTAHIFKKLSE
ncbi:SDR family NAD(P)-dependent oxidoreductase [Pelagibacteraceae bacterium]|jgi:NAD(P)-dependent dehydrogenase (short-subunit alcohol dehydrogenase family)|nr:SDR family NAD(P)-dependent oxidoreductase [Pelagibacteraceae bacterium]